MLTCAHVHRNYGETLYSVAKAPFQEVTTPTNLLEIFFNKSRVLLLKLEMFYQAASAVQVCDGPALLNGELQSGYRGGSFIFYTKKPL